MKTRGALRLSTARAPAPTERRAGDERRTRTLRALVIGSLRPRRRGPRRARDASLSCTDWHHPQWLAVCLLILTLSIVDALLTLMLLDRGAGERNPVMAAFLNGSPHGFAAVKIGLTGAGVILLTLLGRVRAFGRLRVGLLLYAVLGAYVVLIGYEIWLLQGALAQL